MLRQRSANFRWGMISSVAKHGVWRCVFRAATCPPVSFYSCRRSSVDGEFHQCRQLDLCGGGAQCVPEQIRVVDESRLDALLRQRAEIDIGKAGADGALQSEVPAEFEKRLVQPVLDDHESDALELGRRPQPLD